jgi:hypothetical protein
VKKLIAAGSLTLCLAGCSHNQTGPAPAAPSTGVTPPPPAPPSPQVTSLHGSVATGTMQSFDVSLNDQQTSLTATLTWNDADVDLDLWLTDQACQRVSLDCHIYGRSTLPPGTGNKEMVQASLSRSTTYRLWVQNFSGPREEPFVLEVQAR